MRIVGGEFRGRPLAAPRSDAIRPTTDRTREAVFNVLAHRFAGKPEGARVLDLFAGTGALGLEALSRGASYAVFIEESVEGRGLIRANVEALGLTGRTKIWAAVMRQIEDRPWLGYGYATIWDEKGVWTPLAWIVKDAGFKPVHAHNAWLEQWLGMGILGLTAFALTYAQVVLTALISMFRSPGAYLAVPFLLVYSLMSLTESIAVTYNDLRWVLFVAIAVKLAWPDRRAAD